MPEWFIDQWPYYIAVLVATVLTVLVLRVTFLRLRELHLEIERLQLKNEQLSRKLEEEGVTVFRPALQVTRFGLLGNLLPVLTLAVLVLVVVYSNIRGMRARIKHSEQMEEYFNRWENVFHIQEDTFRKDVVSREEIESFQKSIERKVDTVREELMAIQIKSNFRPAGSSDRNDKIRLRYVRTIKEKVIEIISEQMGADKLEITRGTSFINDLNADSLDTVELVMEFEDEFDISIPDEDAEKIQTVGAAIDYIIYAVHYEIYKKVQKVLVDALGVDDDEVTAVATLMGDLGAEEIDFLDIVFRLEKTFAIKIQPDELFPFENLVDSAYVYNGKFTEKGLAMLREKMWHTDVTAFERDPDIKKLGDLFTVGSIVNYVKTKLYVPASLLYQ